MLLHLSLGLLETAKHIMPHALCLTAFHYGPQHTSKQTMDQICGALLVIPDTTNRFWTQSRMQDCEL